ncbi:MAG: glycosyltransferase [Deltaproteobacteria bacterium]|jgi:glycosyltransferase involved in cell wall biosynthesis|nr:glycosyltransferase [Deltaproteobacteria bacterium]
MPDITLCTYAYNDEALALGLIASVPSWTLGPQRLLVVDDGSSPPFAMPQDTCGMEAELLRLPKNRGVGKAKATGLSRAKTELILSLDCDMRLSSRWLAEAVPTALLPDTGIVGAPFVTDTGSGVVGRYQKQNYLDAKQPAGEAPFLPGCVWLFRREVWRAAEGFGGYTGRTSEDHLFCARVKRLGLRLLKIGKEARQVRRLSRIAMVKRALTWHGPPMRKGSKDPESLETGVMLLTKGLVQRLDHALRLNEPLFVYLELLLLAVYGAACCEGPAKNHQREADACAATLLRGLADLCAPFPRLSELLRRDFAALKLEPPETTEHCPIWQNALDAFAALVQGGIFVHIESFLPLLLEEDGQADFSFYADDPS